VHRKAAYAMSAARIFAKIVKIAHYYSSLKLRNKDKENRNTAAIH
jgi:hypothetical protein